MCGIFGSVFTATHVDVAAALASIRHRGPDASGVFRRPGVVLGHNRLSIIDLSEAANQPMLSRDQNVAVVFNGEIYNHHEVRAELEKLGHQFRTRSDTEVIVEGYLAWGADVIERLDGMFAIAIYDDVRRRLVLARDRAGKKPLFYTCSKGSLRFASEIKALRASGVHASMDLASLPTLLSLGYVMPPRTMFTGIQQLAPASVLVLDEGESPRERRYWHAPFEAPALKISFEEASREIRRLVDRAVARRLESDVPLGAFLSGGFDSTIVVGLMARRMSSRVKTFSIGFSGDTRFDETRYARVASEAFGTEHTEFVLEPASFDLVERLVAMHDGPFGDSSAIPTSVVSMLTREHVTVALSGDGGDELFCGYPRFLALEMGERVPKLARRLGGLVARRLPEGRREGSPIGRVRRLLQRSAMARPERMFSYTSFFTFELSRILKRELQELPTLRAPLDVSAEICERYEGARPLARALAHNFETYLPGDLLVKADRASMMHSLEVRSPFLDTELVEFAARLPAHHLRRLDGTHNKRVLRHAFRDVLPPAIAARKDKMGFGIPLGTWFRGSLSSYLRDHLGPSARLWEYLDRRFVEDLLRAHFAKERDEGLRLWLLLTLEIWLRSLDPPRLR